MAVFKCKMCGGNIEFTEGATVGICDSCGTKQTLPNVNDEAIGSLYNRANTLRMKSEFDRAEEMYNKIISADEKQAEAYWGIILCKYGIEYVEDPKTYKRVPTCHRASFDAITADEDYKLAVKYGDSAQKELYKAEAKAIDSIQKDILKIAKNEKPFDVFICYKETDENGKRTQDSVIANEIYHQLTLEGFKVFYSAITLEDKLGQEYEPYIFAALNSAKVMLVVGSKPEYFTAVWVKNEWSRFLKIMKTDRSKLLIPCYKDMDAYELPDDFAHLQAQDMGKIGFINDITRGIKKVIVKESAPAQPTVKETVVMQNENGNVQALLDRGFMALEDGEWEKADGFFEQALNFDAKIARAYLGKLMAELRVKKEEDLKNCDKPFDSNNNCIKAGRFDSSLAEKLEEDNRIIIERIEKRNAEIKAKQEADRIEAERKAEAERIEAERRAEEYRIEAERRAEEKRIAFEKTKDKIKKIAKIATPIVAVAIVFIIVLNTVIIPKQKLNKAMTLLDSGDYDSAYALLEEIGNNEAIASSKYDKAIKFIDSGDYEQAYILLNGLNYKDSDDKLQSIKPKYQQILLSKANVGDTVIFGTYEQDNDTSNGKEDIEWLVLAKEDNKILVISDKELDYQLYNTSYTNVTWETCSLRKWMNGTFLNNAFSTEDQTQIQSTTVPADKNPKYSTNPGNATTDKVFLLSITEVEQYFSSDEDRKCVPTKYAIAQGAWTLDSYTKGGAATCWWWLRSPGYNQNSAADVDCSGLVDYFGLDVRSDDFCVRPALWINLD